MKFHDWPEPSVLWFNYFYKMIPKAVILFHVRKSMKGNWFSLLKKIENANQILLFIMR